MIVQSLWGPKTGLKEKLPSMQYIQGIGIL